MSSNLFFQGLFFFRALFDQKLSKGMEQDLSSFTGIMDELKEPKIKKELLLVLNLSIEYFTIQGHEEYISENTSSCPSCVSWF